MTRRTTMLHALLLYGILLLGSPVLTHAAQVTLRWDHTPTAAQPDIPTSFQVLACQGVGCTPVDLPGAVTASTVTTYVHTGIATNSIYCYQVVALNNQSRSEPSNTACGGYFAPPAPASSLTLTFAP